MLKSRAFRASALLCASLAVGASARATIIASDHYLTGGTGNYTAGAMTTQAATGGTTGYASTSKWAFSTSAFNFETGGLTNPKEVIPAGSNDGDVLATGNGNPRSQIRT